MAPDSGDDDAAALRERVRELEQTVNDQQTTTDSLQEPTPSRRGVLAALTGVAGAGALGAYSQRASAQAAGQVGTSSEPVDVEAYNLNVQGSLTGVDTGVENPLTETLDAGGNSVTNVGAVEANSGTVTSLDGTDLQYESVNADDIHSGSLSHNAVVYENGGTYHAVLSDGTKYEDAELAIVLSDVMENHRAHVYLNLGGTHTFDPSQGNNGTVRVRGDILEGPGMGKLTLQVANGADPSFIFRTQTGGAIMGLTIDGNTANNISGVGMEANDASFVRVENVTIQNTPDYSLNLQNNTDDVYLENVTTDSTIRTSGGVNHNIHNCDVTGQIAVNATTGAYIYGNKVRGSGDNGISTLGGATGVIISGNDVDTTGTRGIAVGIEATKVSVVGNISSAGGMGISIDTVSGNGTVQDTETTVANNIVYGCGTHGINVQNDKFVTVSGNVVDNCTRGIAGNATSSDAQHYIIANNEITNCSNYAIDIRAAGSAILGCVATGNGGDGILVNAPESAITGCVIVGNGGIGIDADGTDDAITGNISLGNTGGNLDTTGATTPTTTGNVT